MRHLGPRDGALQSALGVKLAALLALGLGLSACTVEGTAISAAATVGVTATQERGFQGAMQDTRIRMEINHLWFQESEELYRDVYLQVQEGRVLLSGKVEEPETKVTAARLVWQVPGVKQVFNEIEVTDHSSLTSYARDNLISTELKGKLLVDREVSAVNYSIETVNQVIFLIGVAQSQAELDRVVGHAKDIRYVRGVVNHVTLKDDPIRRAAAAPST